MRCAYLSAAGVAALICLAIPVAAQGNGEPLTINLSGAGSMAVEVSTGEGRESLGRAVAGQPMQVLASALNIGKGKRVNATVDRTGPEAKLVLVPEGTTDATCKAAQATEEGACEVVGGFPWGETPSLGFALSNGALTLSSRADLGRSMGRFTLGVGYEFSSYTSAEDVGCAQSGITECTADASGSGFQAFAEFNVARNIDLGVRYGTSGYAIDQSYSGATQRHDVSLHSYETYVRFMPLGRRPISPFLSGGWGWWCNESEIFSGGSLLGSRGESGGRLFGEAGLQFLFNGSSIGARASAGFGSGGSEDADTRIRGAFGLTVTF